jgi:hypothetical protein
MRLTAYISRETEQIAATRSNRDDQIVVIGILHETSNKLLAIAVHPDGTLTCEYAPVIGDRGETQYLGRFDDDGVLELVEPRPLGNDEEF